MTLSSILAGLAALLAAAALLLARRAGGRVDRMTEAYWELRYEVGQLRVRISRLETVAGLREPEAEPEPDSSARPAQTTTFVPLSSLKK